MSFKLDLIPLARHFHRDSLIHGFSLHQLYARKMIQDLEEGNGSTYSAPRDLSQGSQGLFGGFGFGNGTTQPSEDPKAMITALGLKYQIATK